VIIKRHELGKTAERTVFWPRELAGTPYVRRVKIGKNFARAVMISKNKFVDKRYSTPYPLRKVKTARGRADALRERHRTEGARRTQLRPNLSGKRTPDSAIL